MNFSYLIGNIRYRFDPFCYQFLNTCKLDCHRVILLSEQSLQNTFAQRNAFIVDSNKQSSTVSIGK